MQANPVIELFLALGIIIAAAKVAGTVARWLGQPRVFGELLAGVVLGPTVLNLMHWGVFADLEHLDQTVHELAELGVLFLMFNVGLDVHLKELLSVGRVAVLGGTAGALLPVAMTLPLAAAFGFSGEVALFIGVTLAATSVSISAQTLLELGVLRTKEGFALLATALIDDVLAILLVSFAVATTGSGSADPGALGLILLRMALYLVAALAVAWFVVPRFVNWLANRPETSAAYGIPAFAVFAALMFGWSAEALGGVAAITGAFLAGLGFSRANSEVKTKVGYAMRDISYAFLVPIFFVSVGLSTDLRQISADILPFTLILLLVAAVSKIIGSGAGAMLGGFEWRQAARVGVCMISRGEVGLIIAAVGLSLGVFSETLFPALFLVILLTTVLTPPLVRWAFSTNWLKPLNGDERAQAEDEHGTGGGDKVLGKASKQTEPSRVSAR